MSPRSDDAIGISVARDSTMIGMAWVQDRPSRVEKIGLAILEISGKNYQYANDALDSQVAYGPNPSFVYRLIVFLS